MMEDLEELRIKAEVELSLAKTQPKGIEKNSSAVKGSSCQRQARRVLW